MTAQGFTDHGSTTADILIAGEFPRVAQLVTVSGSSFKRGAVLSKANNKYKLCSSAPEAILAEDVDATSEDKQAVVYLTGEFNLSALTAGVDVSTLIDDLRAKSIFVKQNQSY